MKTAKFAKNGLRGFMFATLVVVFSAASAYAEDGYELWLRYAPVADAGLRAHYLASVTGVRVEGS